MKHKLFSALLGISALGLQAAAADTLDGTIKALDTDLRVARTVDISVFDLNTLDGVARAHSRIASTAYQVCAPILSRVRADQRLYRVCIQESVDDAITRAAQVNLSSFHEALPEKVRSHIWKAAPHGWQPEKS